jgi:hypothetical protein
VERDQSFVHRSCGLRDVVPYGERWLIFPKTRPAGLPRILSWSFDFLDQRLLWWEVGSFVPIGRGAFSMFSLSEHLLFALQALPIALAATGFLGVYALAIRTALEHRRFGFARRGEARRARRRRLLIRAGLVGLYLCSAIFLAGALHLKLAFFLLASGARSPSLSSRRCHCI